MEKYVLDTNLFFNMEPGLGIGKKTDEVIRKVVLAIKKLKNKAIFYMSPSIVKELKSFFKNEEISILKNLLSEVVVKSPDISKIAFPADVFYKLIQDIRERSYKGLITAEDELIKAITSLNGIKFKDKQEEQTKIGSFIKNLRERYRKNTRLGFLDSTADLDIILLAKEQNAYLISTDVGVVSLGRIFGVKEMDPVLFGKKLTHLE